jgi:hypothetical protein
MVDHPPSRPDPPAGPETGPGPVTGAELDWFGRPLADRGAPAVPCPRCGAPHGDRSALAAHLADAHDIALPRPKVAPPVARFGRWWSTIGHLPLWFVLPVTALCVITAATVAAPLGWWYSAYAGGLATLPLVVVLSARLSHR